ncbi:protein brunelleschi-like isoform X1 [Rhagoletis pomonella]|uniref:protein brunelleschi-like isoform X1 n=1 Tax=Rhagoletis pomonella TaxID=28610 RepID=UPI0017866833|nr:protein brunelleschi-like isoform X1 [Rhagoletis pomonella]
MRANVGLILSHEAGETIMSRPDYEQNALHHGCLLVLLRGVGPSKPRSLQKAFDKVRRVSNVKINDSTGATRDIWVRYIHDHPVENNDWGDFQTHRRLIGLITIGKFESQTELNELCRQHESLKVRYSGTLYDSRAIFFGPSPANHVDKVNSAGEDHQGEDTTAPQVNDNVNVNCNVDKHCMRLQDEYTTPSNFKAQAFFYREQDSCDDLEPHIAEFVHALFWVLEWKRLDRSREKVEKVSLLLAPKEKRDFVGIDMESRSNRKRCVGRVTKNLADLSLQAGLVEYALSHYHSACETLRAIGDALWVAACEEGLCSASAILLYPHLRENEPLHRNSSLQDGASPLRATPEKWRASDMTVKVNTPEQQHNSYADGHAGTPTVQMTSASSSCSSVSSISTNSSTSGTPTSSSTSTISAAQHGTRTAELPGNILKPDELPGYYRRAIINYSNYGHAAVIETEAALKAARICTEQNRPLDVAMFLQNILYLNVRMSEPDRVKRFEVITDLYHQIGYRRKAAFFQRLAALKFVQQGNPNPDWSQTYRLMLESFSGYSLALDPMEVIDNAAGWPALQIDLLQGVIAAARRLGPSALATRHMTFLLQTQWAHMTPTEQSDMCVQLQNLSAQCEGSPVPLVLENGTVIPPANLTDLPYCMDLVVRDLPAHLRPQRIKIVKADSGPFLFTPIHLNSIDRREKKREKNKIAFFWAQNNLSEVTLRLRNPLPFELTVSDMRLLTNGIVFESLPQTVILQPHVPTTVTLHGTPIEVGQLEVQGYSTHALGVKSNCRLKNMRGRKFPPNYLIDVIPALPRISVKTSLPQTATFSQLASSDIVITSASLTLYNGESSSCIITITNESPLPVEHLELSFNSNVEQEVQKKIFKIDEKELQLKLPIQPNSSIDFMVHIYGEAEFVCPIVSQHAGSVHSNSTVTAALQADYAGAATISGGPHSLQYSTLSSSGHASLPSRVGSPNQQLQQQSAYSRRNDPNNLSFRSPTSGGTTTCGTPSLAALSLPAAGAQGAHGYGQHVEAQFRIKYSGGEGMQEGYCRQCAISFNLELLPSAQITSWDVLPAEIPSQFYLVLDVSNLTAQEMSLNYTNNKSILIEAKESCRVPIPVDRCSLEQVVAAREAEYAENMEKEKKFGIYSPDLCYRTQLLSFSDSISKLCSEHIAERVKISWLLTGTDIQGIASLHGIVLTPAMIDLTTVSPLQWTVSFQNTPVQPQSEIVCAAGQSAVLNVSVSNQSAQPLRNLVLTIKFYQDYLNGMENYNLDTRVAISGPNRVSIPLLQKHAQIQHECTVIFFTPGRFKASIQCCSKPQSKVGQPAGGIAQALDCSAPALQISDIVGSTSSYHEQQEHVWKFIPPIEVTVIEQ